MHEHRVTEHVGEAVEDGAHGDVTPQVEPNRAGTQDLVLLTEHARRDQEAVIRNVELLLLDVAAEPEVGVRIQWLRNGFEHDLTLRRRWRSARARVVAERCCRSVGDWWWCCRAVARRSRIRLPTSGTGVRCGLAEAEREKSRGRYPHDGPRDDGHMLPFGPGDLPVVGLSKPDSVPEHPLPTTPNRDSRSLRLLMAVVLVFLLLLLLDCEPYLHLSEGKLHERLAELLRVHVCARWQWHQTRRS